MLGARHAFLPLRVPALFVFSTIVTCSPNFPGTRSFAGPGPVAATARVLPFESVRITRTLRPAVRRKHAGHEDNLKAYLISEAPVLFRV